MKNQKKVEILMKYLEDDKSKSIYTNLSAIFQNLQALGNVLNQDTEISKKASIEFRKIVDISKEIVACNGLNPEVQAVQNSASAFAKSFSHIKEEKKEGNLKTCYECLKKVPKNTTALLNCGHVVDIQCLNEYKQA